ncbi:DUF2325 domain-containing protein [Sporosarcina sp. FSL K6-1508]|uniref:DUF2325 domain-containing protein n=1 Tax=Sporosarcina sp. FSL K6-1508 TaxID=2921553 RepID=UPI0030F6FBCA
MAKRTVAIIGGSQEQSFIKIGKKMGCNVLFHNGITRNGGTKKDFRPLVKKADCVVLLLGACSHVTMNIVKNLCKEHEINIAYHQGFGVSGALNAGIDIMEAAV